MIEVSFWDKDTKYIFMFDMGDIRLDEILACIEEQYLKEKSR